MGSEQPYLFQILKRVSEYLGLDPPYLLGLQKLITGPNKHWERLISIRFKFVPHQSWCAVQIGKHNFFLFFIFFWVSNFPHLKMIMNLIVVHGCFQGWQANVEKWNREGIKPPNVESGMNR